MRVLEQDQNWLLFRQSLHLIDQGGERLTALLSGREIERRIAAPRRDRQHRRDQGRDLAQPVGRETQELLQFVELGLGTVLRSQPRRALELLGERIERAVAVIGRALVAQSRVRGLRDLFGDPSGNARLADARLARDQHDLALALEGPALPREKVPPLRLASDEAGQAGRMGGLEAAIALGDSKRREGFHRLGQTLERLLAEVANPKTIADQTPRRQRDHDSAGIGEALQPRREIGGVADDRLLLRWPLADDVADYDEAGRDP